MSSNHDRAVPQISFLVPCLNEEKNIVSTLETIQTVSQSLGLRYEVVVIDDASTDQTSKTIQSYIDQNPDIPVRLFRNDRNYGLGYNYSKGITLAQGEYYMSVFGDHSEPPQALKNILSKMGKADIVIPYVEDQSQRSFMRRIVSISYTGLCNFLSGKNIRYYNGPVLHKLSNLLKCRNIGSGFGYQSELLCQLLSRNVSYVEVPIPINSRASGGSTAFRISNIISVAGSILKIFKFRFFKG